MVALEDLLGECDHVLDLNVEAVADAFEEDVGDVEVDDEDVTVEGGFDLEVLVLGEEGEEEVAQLLSDRLEVDLLLVEHGLVDLLLDQRLALRELVEQLADQRAHLLVLHVLLRVLVVVAPEAQRQPVEVVVLVVLRDLDLLLLELVVGLGELRLAREEGQLLGPEVDGLDGELDELLGVLQLLLCIKGRLRTPLFLPWLASSMLMALQSLGGMFSSRNFSK